MPEQNDIAHVQTDPVPEMTCSNCESLLDVSELDSFAQLECPECSTSLTVPAKLGGFRLERLLGSGGMGAIYEGIDESLGRHVAVKVVLSSLADDEEALETFQREARMLAALNHPNIVQIYSLGQEKGQPYIVMELVSGKRLNEMIEKGEPLSQSLVLKIATHVAEGLNVAYEMGIVHGDIKPENILLDRKGIAKVVDFGLASFADKQTTEGGVWGTPYYIAPEKLRKQPADARSDIYSLGATLYHALAAAPPFDGDTPVEIVKARIGTPAPPVSQTREGILPAVDAVVARMLEEQPARRYPNYSSLLGDLKKANEALKTSSGPLAADSGKRVVTRKARAIKGESGEIERTDPTISRVVLKKKHRKPLSADMASDYDEHERYQPGKMEKFRGLIVAASIAVVMLTVTGTVLGIKHVAAQRAERERFGYIVGQVSDAAVDMTTRLGKTLTQATALQESAKNKKRRYKEPAEAVALVESALKAATRAKADAQELSDNIKQIEAEKAALAANPPLSRAESALRTIQNILEITESLPNEIAKDLNKASTNLKKASDLWLASRAVE